jgi:hypothetical protein
MLETNRGAEIKGHWQDAWNNDPSQIRTDVFYLLRADRG